MRKGGNKMIHFSSFLGTIAKEGTTVIFHKLHPYPIYVDTNIWEKLKKNPKKGDKDLIRTLKKRQLIIQSNNKDIEELKKTRIEYGGKIKQVTNLYLILTRRCNLKCRYCFISQAFKEEERKAMMTPEIIKKGIDLWAKHVARNSMKNIDYSIIFYGGEPLVNLPTFRIGLEYIQKLQNRGKLPQKNLKKIIITNGILVNKKIARLFKKHSVEVTVSIDGPVEVHDICRIDKAGRGTFKKVQKAMKVLRSEGISLYASTTITPYNIGIVKEIPNLFAEMGIKGFGLNKLVGKTLFLLEPEIDLENYNKQASQEIINTFLSARNKGIYEERLGEKADAFIKKEFYPSDCKAYGGQIVIQPDGQISNCFASSRYNIKHVKECGDNFWIWNTSLPKEWKERLPLYNAECLNCEAISICGGGCPWSAEEVKGNPLKKDEAFCIYTKKAFEFLIWDSYNNHYKD